MLIIPVIATSPLLYLQSIFLLEKEHLQFYPLAFAAVVYFFYNEGKDNSFSVGIRLNIAKAIVAILFATSCYALVRSSPWLAHLCLVLQIFAWALGRFSNLSVLRIAGICGLIAVTVPAPMGLDQKLVQSLQSLSSNISSRLMDVTNIHHLKRGNIIEINSKPLFVEEACSGVDSQYALMAVAGVLLLVGRAGLIVSLITIVTVPIWAILGNLLRIYLIVVGLEFLDIDLSIGMAHTVLGLVVFSLAAYAHWSSVQFLNYLELKYFTKEASPEYSVALPSVNKSKVAPKADINSIGQTEFVAKTINKKETNTTDTSKRKVGFFIATAVLLLLMPVGGLAVVRHYTQDIPTLSQDIVDRFPGEKDLPARVGDQTRVYYMNEARDRRNLLGQFSRIWTYNGNLGVQIAALDMPFRGWHPLWDCYLMAGWNRIRTEEIRSVANGMKLAFPFFETVLENEEGEFAVMHFSLFTEDGLPFTDAGVLNPNLEESPAVPNSPEGTTLRAQRSADQTRDPLTFQFQLLSKTRIAASNKEIQQFREMYLELRTRVFEKSMPVVQSLKGL